MSPSSHWPINHICVAESTSQFHISSSANNPTRQYSEARLGACGWCEQADGELPRVGTRNGTQGNGANLCTISCILNIPVVPFRAWYVSEGSRLSSWNGWFSICGCTYVRRENCCGGVRDCTGCKTYDEVRDEPCTRCNFWSNIGLFIRLLSKLFLTRSTEISSRLSLRHLLEF